MLRKGFKSITYAWRGLKVVWHESSFRTQILAAGLVCIASAALHISRAEWIGIVLSIGIVLATESINTAIEGLCDHVHPEEHPDIAAVKDVAASASAIAGGMAIIIGCIIFIPHLAAL